MDRVHSGIHLRSRGSDRRSLEDTKNWPSEAVLSAGLHAYDLATERALTRSLQNFEDKYRDRIRDGRRKLLRTLETKALAIVVDEQTSDSVMAIGA